MLERPNGKIAALEVKSSARVSANDFKGIRTLQNIVKNDFACGVVLYTGREAIPFGEKLFAVPISALWQ